MKKKILYVFLAIVILAAGLGGGYWLATDAATADGEEVPEWQAVIEQRVAPLVISAISTVCAWWFANQPTISKINAAADAATTSAAGFDGAAGGITAVKESSAQSAAEVRALREEVEKFKKDLMNEIVARFDQEQKLLVGGVKMMGLAFSHEAELVKNGTAREIMETELELVKNGNVNEIMETEEKYGGEE